MGLLSKVLFYVGYIGFGGIGIVVKFPYTVLHTLPYVLQNDNEKEVIKSQN